MKNESLAVCISVYRPDEGTLCTLLHVVREHGGPVLLHIDGPTGEAIDARFLGWLKGDERLTILQASQNSGIAAALNRLADAAEQMECTAVLFFDQDSQPSETTATRLREALGELEASGWRPAVVGPALTCDPEAPTRVPHYRDRPSSKAPPSCRATDYVITSGSLMTIAALRDIGPFKTQFRMDAIDVEWCFRAWAKGYSVWYVSSVPMQHRVGEGIVSAMSIRFPLQSTARMRSYARNQFHLLRLAHIPSWWKLRILVYVPVQLVIFTAKAKDHRLRLAGQLLRSLFDGLTSRFGHPN